MNTQKTTILIYYYGAFLLLSGICLVILSGIKVDLTSISLLTTGLISGGIGFAMSQKIRLAFWAGLIFVSIMIFYFGWLTIINGNGLVDMLLDGELQLKPFHAAHQQAATFSFSLVSWILSIMSSMTQFVRAYAIGRELNSQENADTSI